MPSGLEDHARLFAVECLDFDLPHALKTNVACGSQVLMVTTGQLCMDKFNLKFYSRAVVLDWLP